MNRATRSATNEPVPSGAATPRRTGHSRVQSIGGEPTAPVLQSKSGRRARSSVPALSSFALRESTTKPSGKTRASHAGFRPVIQEETLAAVIDIEVPNADDRVAYPSSPATVRLASRAHLRRPPKLRESLIKNPPLKMEDRAEGLEKYAQQCILSQIGSVLKDGVEEINEDQMGLDLEVLETTRRTMWTKGSGPFVSLSELDLPHGAIPLPSNTIIPLAIHLSNLSNFFSIIIDPRLAAELTILGFDVDKVNELEFVKDVMKSAWKGFLGFMSRSAVGDKATITLLVDYATQRYLKTATSPSHLSAASLKELDDLFSLSAVGRLDVWEQWKSLDPTNEDHVSMIGERKSAAEALWKVAAASRLAEVKAKKVDVLKRDFPYERFKSEMVAFMNQELQNPDDDSVGLLTERAIAFAGKVEDNALEHVHDAILSDQRRSSRGPSQRIAVNGGAEVFPRSTGIPGPLESVEQEEVDAGEEEKVEETRPSGLLDDLDDAQSPPDEDDFLDDSGTQEAFIAALQNLLGETEGPILDEEDFEEAQTLHKAAEVNQRALLMLQDPQGQYEDASDDYESAGGASGNNEGSDGHSTVQGNIPGDEREDIDKPEGSADGGAGGSGGDGGDSDYQEEEEHDDNDDEEEEEEGEEEEEEEIEDEEQTPAAAIGVRAPSQSTAKDEPQVPYEKSFKAFTSSAQLNARKFNERRSDARELNWESQSQTPGAVTGQRTPPRQDSVVPGTPESARSTGHRNEPSSSSYNRTPRARQLISTTASPTPQVSGKTKGKQPSQAAAVRLPPVPEHPNAMETSQRSSYPDMTPRAFETFLPNAPAGPVASSAVKRKHSQSHSLHRMADIPLVRTSGRVSQAANGSGDVSDSESVGLRSVTSNERGRYASDRPRVRPPAHHRHREMLQGRSDKEFFNQFFVDGDGEPLHDENGHPLRIDNKYGAKVPLGTTGKVGKSGYRYAVSHQDPPASWSEAQSVLLYREVQKVPLLAKSAFVTAVHHRWGKEEMLKEEVNLVPFNIMQCRDKMMELVKTLDKNRQLIIGNARFFLQPDKKIEEPPDTGIFKVIVPGDRRRVAFDAEKALTERLRQRTRGREETDGEDQMTDSQPPTSSRHATSPPADRPAPKKRVKVNSSANDDVESSGGGGTGIERDRDSQLLDTIPGSSNSGNRMRPAPKLRVTAKKLAEGTAKRSAKGRQVEVTDGEEEEEEEGYTDDQTPSPSKKQKRSQISVQGKLGLRSQPDNDATPIARSQITVQPPPESEEEEAVEDSEDEALVNRLVSSPARGEESRGAEDDDNEDEEEDAMPPVAGPSGSQPPAQRPRRNVGQYRNDSPTGKPKKGKDKPKKGKGKTVNLKRAARA